jgi:hypothetical protein
MHNAMGGDRMRGLVGCLVLLLLVLASSACGDSANDEPVDMSNGPSDGPKKQESDEPMRSHDSVCPDCAPFAPGGETSDFGSELAACTLAYETREVTAAEAHELGFDVATIADAMEQPIDAALTWRASESEGGGPASGFEPETRVRGTIDVRSYTHYWLDPELCDGTMCTLDDGTETEQASCPEHYILFKASGELATDDGALEATFPEQPVWILSKDSGDTISVAARADLSAVHGSLRIDPAIPTPRIGALDLSLEIPQSGQRGALQISVYPDWDHPPPDAGTIPRELSYYAPLEGRWGDWSGQSWPTPLTGQPMP